MLKWRIKKVFCAPWSWPKKKKEGKQICHRRVDDNFLDFFRPSFFVCFFAVPLFLYFQSISWQHYRCKQQRSSNMFALSRPPAAHLSFINLFLQYINSIFPLGSKYFLQFPKNFFFFFLQSKYFPRYLTMGIYFFLKKESYFNMI